MELVTKKSKKKKPTPLPEPDRSPEPEFVATHPDKQFGQAVYRHCGNCYECGTPVYLCVSHPERADDVMGNSLAAFVAQAANRAPSPYCQTCYHNFMRTSLAGNYKPIDYKIEK